ncbi:hypothetical protein KC331_g50 [Hortaea werneckii]|nr:hypothetical protein KC331_g50 [Hortaea werneckii]
MAGNTFRARLGIACTQTLLSRLLRAITRSAHGYKKKSINVNLAKGESCQSCSVIQYKYAPPPARERPRVLVLYPLSRARGTGSFPEKAHARAGSIVASVTFLSARVPVETNGYDRGSGQCSGQRAAKIDKFPGSGSGKIKNGNIKSHMSPFGKTLLPKLLDCPLWACASLKIPRSLSSRPESKISAVAGVNVFACPKAPSKSSAQQKSDSQNCTLHMKPTDTHPFPFPHLPFRTPIALIEPRSIPGSSLILHLGTMPTLPAQLHFNLLPSHSPHLERDLTLRQAGIAGVRKSLKNVLPRALELQLGVIRPLANVLAVRSCVRLLRRSFAGFLLDEVLAVGADLEATHHDIVVPGIVSIAEEDTQGFAAEVKMWVSFILRSWAWTMSRRSCRGVKLNRSANRSS